MILLTVVLCILLLQASPLRAQPEQGSSISKPLPFSDLTSDQNRDFIIYLVNRGIISGFPDGTFRPNQGLTRAEAATIMAKAGGLEISSVGSSPFIDVSADYWAASYIAAAAQAGYIKGFPDGTFRPDETLTREQGISLVLRLSQQPLTEASLPELSDVDNSHWAADSIAVGIEAELIGLTADGKRFLPQAAFTRSNMARAVAMLLTQSPDLYETSLVGKIIPQGNEVKLGKSGQTELIRIKDELSVYAGDLIEVGKGSKAEIKYPDGSSLLIKENTQVTIKESRGRSYIKANGALGTAVEYLNVDLSRGTMLAALATKKDDGTEKNIESSSLNHRNRDLLAVLDPANLWLANQTSSNNQPWWQAYQNKKVKVKVDMPWGVAAVRGTFLLASVNPQGGGTISCLDGITEVSSYTSTGELSDPVAVTGGQETNVAEAGAPPSPPAPMSQDSIQQFAQEQEWLVNTAKEMDNQREMTPPPPETAQENGSEPPEPPPTPPEEQSPPNSELERILSAMQDTGIQAPDDKKEQDSSASGGDGSTSSPTVSEIISLSGGSGSPIKDISGKFTDRVEKGTTYILPTSARVKMSNGQEESRTISWNPASVDTNTVGTFNFTGTISNYAGYITLQLSVIEISEIQDINISGNVITFTFNKDIEDAYIDETEYWYPIVTAADGTKYKIWVVDSQGNYSLCLHTVKHPPGSKQVEVYTIGSQPDTSYNYYVYKGSEFSEEIARGTITFPEDQTPPRFEEGPYVQTTANTMELKALVYDFGTLYYLILEKENKLATFDFEYIKAWALNPEDYADGRRSWSGYTSFYGEVVLRVTGLIGNKNYYLYAVMEDMAGNRSEVSELTFFTLEDNEAPVFISGYPKIDTSDEGTAKITVKSSEPGHFYYVVLKQEDTEYAPQEAGEVKDWVPGSERIPPVQIFSCSGSLTIGFDEGFAMVQDLEAGKYMLYAAVEDECNNLSSLLTMPFTIQGIYGSISGKVQFVDGTGMANVPVTLKKGESDVATVTTDESGNFIFEKVEPGTGYIINISLEGYKKVDYLNIEVSSGTTTYLGSIILQLETDNTGGIEGFITNALNGEGISGLDLKLRAGLNATSGEPVASGVTKEGGYYSFSDLLPGNYTIEVSGEGYVTTYFTVNCAADTVNQINSSVTPVLAEGITRIVLTWGEIPYDLDSHLLGPTSSGEVFEIYYADRVYMESDKIVAELDYDDTYSYGPETITIYEQVPNGEYRYAVYQWSYEGSLAESQATVKVYRGSNDNENLAASFNVPTDQAGRWWTVFTLKDNVITPVNTLSDSFYPGTTGEIWTYDDLYFIGEDVYITLWDPDLYNNHTASVNVVSSSDSNGITINLVNDGYGYFEGKVHLIDGDSDEEQAFLKVKSGDTVRIIYNDQCNLLGQMQIISQVVNVWDYSVPFVYDLSLISKDRTVKADIWYYYDKNEYNNDEKSYYGVIYIPI